MAFASVSSARKPAGLRQADTARTPSTNGRATDGDSDESIARQIWNRYEYGKQRGHVVWSEEAKRNEQYYLGGGLQYLDVDREELEGVQKQLAVELNHIFVAVNNASGYQLSNRLDISFRPRGQGASDEIATTLSKVAMQVADNNHLPWHESQVFLDGLIQQRGYYDVRIAYDDSLRGEIRISTLDPLDVIPDPDAKSYDPDDWNDVIVTRWLTFEEIYMLYGPEAAKAVRAREEVFNDRDFGYAMNEVPRNKFGDETWGADARYDSYYVDGGVQRVRVIDRQQWKLVMTRVVVYPTGDIRVAENATPEQLADFRAKGCITMRRMTRRVRWQVSTADTLLFDDWSPLQHFSVIPYFPFFRRGITRGLVDNARSPQDMINKAATKNTAAVSSSANSGYLVEENSLVGDVTEDDLPSEGSKPGLVLVYAKNSKPPEKIQPNQVPTGIRDLMETGMQAIKDAMGSSDALKGQGGANQSGVSVQSQQFGAQMALALPLDNLTRTRHMLANMILECIQAFYDEPRIFNIAHTDAKTGKKSAVELAVNQEQEDGTVLNDLTLGEYQVVITEQPAQITFENSQYNQALDMRKAGVNVPDPILIRYSTLQDKTEIIEQMEANPHTDPLAEAKALTEQARAALLTAQAVEKNVQALFSAIRTGQVIAAMPQVAAIADPIAKSAGFQDKDGGTIYGQGADTAAPGSAPLPPANTNPLTPDHAARGAEAGIENGAAA
jgi:hypothetical protein